MRTTRVVIVLLAVAVSACRRTTPPAAAAEPRAPVVVQGAMEVEVERLRQSIQDAKEEHVQGWTFWRGTVNGYPVVVSKTLKGTSNAAAATALAVEHYRPAAIINQGTAGGHDPTLHVYDIVVGTEAVNLGAFKTGVRGPGRGSDFGEWVPLDLLRSDGSAGQDPNARVMRRFAGDTRLIAVATRDAPTYEQGRVVEGVIGSSDVWNSELDRIRRFHETFGTSVEEMETAPAAQIAGLSQIPFVGIRILSNNITNGGQYDPGTAAACQNFVLRVIGDYVRTLP